MSNGNKIILSIVLLIAAAGILTWHFKSSNTAAKQEEPQELILNTRQAKAFEAIVAKVGSKKWSDPSLWTSPKAASTYGALAEKLFTATPSMDQMKIMNYGTNKANDDADILILAAPGSEMCIQIEFKPNKSKQLVMDLILESQITVKDYQNRHR